MLKVIYAAALSLFIVGCTPTKTIVKDVKSAEEIATVTVPYVLDDLPPVDLKQYKIVVLKYDTKANTITMSFESYSNLHKLLLVLQNRVEEQSNMLQLYKKHNLNPNNALDRSKIR